MLRSNYSCDLKDWLIYFYTIIFAIIPENRNIEYHF